MKYRSAMLVVAMLALAVLANTAPSMAASGVETFKHHTWDISTLSLSISIDADVAEVEKDLNTLANFFEGVVGAFVGSDYHVFVGNKTYDEYLGNVIWASGFVELGKDVVVPKNLLLTLANITRWMDGEEIPMNETLAEILAFDIPKKSVFVLPPISPAMELMEIPSQNSLEYLLIPKLNIEGVDVGLDMVRKLLHTFLEAPPAETMVFAMLATVPIPLDSFMVGTVLGRPDAIKAFEYIWDSYNQIYGEFFNFKYTESDTEVTFSMSGSISQQGVSISVSFSTKYSLTTGLLLDMSLSLSVSNIQTSIHTHEYGDVPITVSGSIRFGMKYLNSEDLEPWTTFGEPLAYKTTELSFSPDLEDLLREAGLFEESIEIPSGIDTLFYDDAESGNIGWNATGGWHISSADAYSGSYSWYTGPYENNASWWLISPPINVSGYDKVNISYAIKYDLESGFDFGYLKVSWDNGHSWTNIRSFTGYSEDWAVYNDEIDVTGDTMLIAFVLMSDAFTAYNGMWVDDIKVTGIRMEYVSFIDLLRNLRAVFNYTDNPTGLTPMYDGIMYYYNATSGTMMEIKPFKVYNNMLIPGSIRVYPYKDILYGQMQLEAHILTNVLPKLLKYQLAVEKANGEKVPKFDMSGTYKILESNQSHFALLANVSFSVEYTDVEPGDVPFIMSGHGGIWYVYKSTGYLVETGFEFSLQVKFDTNGDGSLDDETTHEYTVKIVVNKVVSEPVKASSGWTINWDRLDSDPPSFTEPGAWSDVTPVKTAGGGIQLEPITIGAAAIVLVLIVAAFLAMRRKKP